MTASSLGQITMPVRLAIGHMSFRHLGDVTVDVYLDAHGRRATNWREVLPDMLRTLAHELEQDLTPDPEPDRPISAYEASHPTIAHQSGATRDEGTEQRGTQP